MAENTGKVLIGARGWQHPGWQGSFYPGDLPQSWRLAYYANEFPMLVIREQEWVQIEDMASLREDCASDFRFVVELPALAGGGIQSRHIDRIRQLGEQCAGVIISVEQTQAQQALADYQSRLPETIPCYMEDEKNSLIKVSSGISLKELRVLMEMALQLPDASPALMIVEGDPPDIELLRNAETMLGLL